MKSKSMSTTLCEDGDKSLSTWNDVILAAKKQIMEMKSSLRTFQELRDSGMVFPKPKAKRRRRLLAESSDQTV